jgi:hypothetical protein
MGIGSNDFLTLELYTGIERKECEHNAQKNCSYRSVPGAA